MPRVQLSLFGHFKLTVNNQPVPRLRSIREAALLTYLAIEPPQPHPRDHLAGLLWPDHSTTAARNNLKQTLSNLRRTLADLTAPTPLLLVDRQTVQFVPNADLWLDVDHFRRNLASLHSHAQVTLLQCASCMAQLAAAADLYQGPLLQPFGAIESDLFEEWLLLRREHFHQQVVLALESLGTYAFQKKNYAESLQATRRLVQLDPLHERAHLQLLQSLLLLGDRAAALAHFESYAARLAAELVVAPSAEMVALVAAIRGEGGGDKETRRGGDKETSEGREVGAGDVARREDWGGAGPTPVLIGRRGESEQITGWLRTGVKVGVLLGLGGVGKSTLALHVARGQADYFAMVVWRSLINAPPPEMTLRNWIHSLSNQAVALPSDVDGQLALLIDLLRRTRSLLVLDNLESVLQEQKAGRYRAGYEFYGQLLRRIAQETHQSTLLVTSRELPAELSALEAESPVVRSLSLAGLPITAGEALLQASGLTSSTQDAALLVQHYSGHPLALKLVASTIHELFQDDVVAFLHQGAPIFGDVRDLFEEQGKRLTELERVILFWLAIEREPVTATAVRAAIIPPVTNSTFLEAFNALQRRLLLEQTDRGFTLQNVVMEAMTDQLIEQMAQEIQQESWQVLNSFALTKAHAPDYVRQSQGRVIVGPLVARLVGQWGQAALVQKLQRLLATLRREAPQLPGYAAGNLLSLLLYLDVDLTGYDFSYLSVWQADLRRATLAGVNFTNADLRDTLFTDTFRAVNHIAFSPNGQLLAASTNDGAIRLWRVVDWQASAILSGHTGEAQAVAFTRDSQRLASASDDQTVRLWDVYTGHLLYTLQGHTHRVQAVAFNPDDQWLASSGNDGTIRLWEAETGRLHHTFVGHTGVVNSIAFLPMGQLVSGSWDYTVRIWDVEQRQLLRTLHGHTNAVRSIAVSADGAVIASGSWDRIVRIWDTQTGQVRHQLQHAKAIASLAFDPTGRWLATAGDDHEVRIWDAEQGQCVQVLSGHANAISAVAFSPDGRLLASASSGPTVRLWDARSGQNLTTLHGYTDRVRTIAFSGDGALLASSGDDELIRLWEIAGQRVSQVVHSRIYGLKTMAFHLKRQTERALIAVDGGDQTVRIWRGNARQPMHILQGHTDIVKALAFSPAGHLLASGGNDQTVRVWDVESGQNRFIFHGHSGFVQTLTFSQQSAATAGGAVLHLISSGDDRAIQVWRMDTGQLVHTLSGHSNVVTALAVAPSPQGMRLVSGSWDRSIRLWDVETGAAMGTLQGTIEIVALAVSPDCRLIAASGFAPTIEVWDVATGEIRHILHGHKDFILSVAFRPGASDEPLLVSASHDGTIKYWSLSSGECVTTLRAPGPYVGMQLGGAVGISAAQKRALMLLGAVEATPPKNLLAHL